jgi:AraC-like DNA-binding protein
MAGGAEVSLRQALKTANNLHPGSWNVDFTRMFDRIVGVSPGAWRRALKE